MTQQNFPTGKGGIFAVTSNIHVLKKNIKFFCLISVLFSARIIVFQINTGKLVLQKVFLRTEQNIFICPADTPGLIRHRLRL